MAIKRAPLKTPPLTQGDLLGMANPEGVREVAAGARIQPATGADHPGNDASLRVRLGIDVDREVAELERKFAANLDWLVDVAHAGPDDPRWPRLWAQQARIELLRGHLEAAPGALERRAAELQASWTRGRAR